MVGSLSLSLAQSTNLRVRVLNNHHAAPTEADLLPVVRKFIGHYLFLTREQFFEETLGSVIIEAAASNMDVCVILLSLSLA